MAAMLTADGIGVTRIADPTFGDVLRADLPGTAGGAPVLLMGHRDTVFAKGTPAVRPFGRDGDMAFGPGVADMKGGLVLSLFVMRALKAAGGTPFPIIGVFTADEEIGSPSGRPVIEAIATGARAAFNAEPGRASGNVVTARKGGMTAHITVTGKAAHSGVAHADGASAIGALAAKITKLHALTDYASGVTTNVGVIRGGQTSTVAEDHAEAELDIRFVAVDQRRRAGAHRRGDPGGGGRACRARRRRSRAGRCSCRSRSAIARRCSRATRTPPPRSALPSAASSPAAAPFQFTGALGIPSLCGLRTGRRQGAHGGGILPA